MCCVLGACAHMCVMCVHGVCILYIHVHLCVCVCAAVVNVVVES